MTNFSDIDRSHMARALELAALGEGHVEPNPMVGCVIAHSKTIVGEGWHQKFGGLHAEAAALKQAGSKAENATLFVTLEPCCHHGKTPPCTDAILHSGIKRAVIAAGDPFPKVDGGGLAALEAGGVTCEVGLLEAEAAELLAPYRKLIATGRPWLIAKWAMTLDGKIATHAGSSQWISNPRSREITHRLRGRVDAILVGSGTTLADDPRLTARPADPKHVCRRATRVVVDSACAISPSGKLVQSIAEAPLLVATSADAPAATREALTAAGAEVLVCAGDTHAERLGFLLDDLGRRKFTNVLVEGGSRLLGQLLDIGELDEAHAFIAPKLVGGSGAPSPIAGNGISLIGDALPLRNISCELLDGDVYLSGRVNSSR